MLQRQNRKDCLGTQPSFRDRYIQLANATSPSVNQKQIPLLFRIFKRCFDVVLALLAIVLLSPLLLCVAIAIKTTSAGPVIFKQERYGRNKKPFICYKFRSMTVDTPSDVPTRVMCERSSVMTPIGSVLRKTSIDELPQLINIVRGDMSVVGPRPMILAEYDQIQARDRYGANDIRPGLTGWAQVNGRDGVTVEQKARLDGEYRQRMGLVMDVRVFLRSIVVVLGRLGYAESEPKEESGVVRCADAKASVVAAKINESASKGHSA